MRPAETRRRSADWTILAPVHPSCQRACLNWPRCYRSNLNDAALLYQADLASSGGPLRGQARAVACRRDAGKSTFMSAAREGVWEDTRFRVLQLLSENPHMSQRQLAEAVGISVGSAHYVLRALVEVGMIKLGNFSRSPDRRRYAYVLTPEGVAQKAVLAGRFLARKLAEYDALRAEIEALRAEIGAELGGGAGE